MIVKRHKWTQEQKDYLYNISEGRYSDEIARLINEKFNLNLKAVQIKKLKTRLGIRSNVTKGNPKMFTEEQRSFIEKNVKDLPNEELAILVNDKFNLKITTQQIKTYKKNNKLSSGLKKFQAVGAVRLTKVGYIEVKIADPNVWKKMHHLIWEKAHGPIPKSHVLIFLDSNKKNYSLNNLKLITLAELIRMNDKKLFFEDAELTEIGINIVRVHQKIIDHELRDGINNNDFVHYVRQAEKKGISKSALEARLRRGWSVQDAISKPLHFKVKKKINQR